MRRVPLQACFLLNEPLTKLLDDRFRTLAVTAAISLLCEHGEVLIYHSVGQHLWLKLLRLTGVLAHPCKKMTENMCIDAKSLCIVSMLTARLIFFNQRESGKGIKRQNL